jgi:signal transduction histidine kinase
MQKVTDNIFLLVLMAMAGILLMAASFIFFFLRYQRNIARQKEAMQKAALEHNAQLLNAALLSQEEERKRIGRDLHDDVGAALSNLKMTMAQAADNTTDRHKPLIDNIITTVRNISHSLSPPGLELFGLEFTLQEWFDNFSKGSNLHIHFTNTIGAQLDRIDKKTALALFRVIQELLSNTLKHAAAKNVTVDFFEAGNTSALTYTDDGKGFSNTGPKKSGMGMQNIEARLKMIGADFTIESEEGKGFTIKILLPASAKQD